jgi:hypothetical protein
MEALVHAFLKALSSAAASSAVADLEVTTSALKEGALKELGVALDRGNDTLYQEALHLCATMGGTAATAAADPTIEFED